MEADAEDDQPERTWRSSDDISTTRKDIRSPRIEATGRYQTIQHTNEMAAQLSRHVLEIIDEKVSLQVLEGNTIAQRVTIYLHLLILMMSPEEIMCEWRTICNDTARGEINKKMEDKLGEYSLCFRENLHALEVYCLEHRLVTLYKQVQQTLAMVQEKF